MAEDNITQVLHTVLTEGEQYDSIQYQNINQLFIALEEIRTFFAETLTGERATESFDTNNSINNNYISKLKTGMQELETSRFIPDDKYSSQVSIPNAFDLIEVGKYYNPYIQLLKDMMQECIHFASNTYDPGSGGECPLNWYFESKCYEWEEGSNYYGNHCLKYNPASCAAHYGECLGYTSDSGDSGGSCVSVCPKQCNDNYANQQDACPIQYSIDGCPSDCRGNYVNHNVAHFAGGDTVCDGQGLCPLDGGSCNECNDCNHHAINWSLCDHCIGDAPVCPEQFMYSLDG